MGVLKGDVRSLDCGLHDVNSNDPIADIRTSGGTASANPKVTHI